MRLRVPMLLVFAAVSAAAQQGSTLPGGHPASIDAQRSQFGGAMRAEVDTLLQHFAEDLKGRKAGWVADDYAASAQILLGDGTNYRRRDDIKKYYTLLFKRASVAKLVVGDVSELRRDYSVAAQLVLQVNASGGAPYEYIVPIKLQLSTDFQNKLEIAYQEGGDLPPLAAALYGDAERSIPVGHGDSLRVRVTSATGLAMGGVQVTFEVKSGHGELSARVVNTNADGIAATYFTSGPEEGAIRVEAVAIAVPNEPVEFRIRATAVAP